MVWHSLLTSDVVRFKTEACDVLMWHQTLSPASSCCPQRARSQPDRDTPCACHARADAAAASFAITAAAAAASSACSSIFHAASRTWNHGYRACQLAVWCSRCQVMQGWCNVTQRSYCLQAFSVITWLACNTHSLQVHTITSHSSIICIQYA